ARLHEIGKSLSELSVGHQLSKLLAPGREAGDGPVGEPLIERDVWRGEASSLEALRGLRRGGVVQLSVSGQEGRCVEPAPPHERIEQPCPFGSVSAQADMLSGNQLGGRQAIAAEKIRQRLGEWFCSVYHSSYPISIRS